MRPSFLASPTPAMPTMSEATTIGMTIILIRRMKISPAGCRTLAIHQAFSALKWLSRAPMAIPSTSPMSICHARLSLALVIVVTL
ncbi:hypothetical protein D3C76_1654310 [compost metagenome]